MDHIAFCGVDCAVCPDFLEKKCPDCRHSEWPDGDPCGTNRGICCCGACETFPCPMMAEFYEESESHRRAYARMKAVAEECR